jgi:apoptosis-inducing factor 2
MAAKVRLEYPHCEVTLVHSRPALLSAEPLPDEYKAKALELLILTGVQVKLGDRVVGHKSLNSNQEEVVLSSGDKLIGDMIIYTATQQGANTGFLPEQGLDKNGCVLVRDT